MTQLTIKRGDILDIAGVVEIIENKKDTTSQYDFALWSITCQIRTGPSVQDDLVTNVAVDFMGSLPSFAGEVNAAVTLTFPETSYIDLRFLDQDGRRRSSQTVVLIAEDSVTLP